MFRLFVLLLAVTCTFGAGLVRRPLPDGRIVGGKDARIEDFPYQVSLRNGGSHICGASIIGKNWVVTAAHCVKGSSASSISFRAGSNSRISGGTIHQAVNITVHPQYNAATIDYDVAVVYVREAFEIGSKGVDAIKLADKLVTPETPAVVSGWGTLTSGGGTLPTTLQEVSVLIKSNVDCDKAYGGSITERMICAGVDQGGKDACQGDSGGPLVASKQLVGVVSWGYGCAVKGYPGVYSSVANSPMRSFIKRITGI